ncbi:Protein of unknown function [Gryllus bimaculatus]|nr:Protein of unknown function [Gryllus bimaculatus]
MAVTVTVGGAFLAATLLAYALLPADARSGAFRLQAAQAAALLAGHVVLAASLLAAEDVSWPVCYAQGSRELSDIHISNNCGRIKFQLKLGAALITTDILNGFREYTTFENSCTFEYESLASEMEKELDDKIFSASTT